MHPPTAHSLMQPLVSFLSVEISLHFLEFYVSESCRRHFFESGFFRSARSFWDPRIWLCTSVACSFLLLSNSPFYAYTTTCLSIHLFMGISFFLRLRLLQIKLLWISVYEFSGGHIFSFNLSKYLELEWLSHLAHRCSTVLGKLYGCTILRSHQQWNVRIPVALCPCQLLALSAF